MSVQVPVPFQQVVLTAGFWQKRIKTVQEKTLPLCINYCEETHRFDNFRSAAHEKQGVFQGIFFNDSDVYKILEGAAYLSYPVDSFVSSIIAAQQPDGYLNTYFILNEDEEKWSDMGLHEDYCLGHMIDAAIARHQATMNSDWLQCAERAVTQMQKTLTGRHWVTGHQGIELALIRLYRHTGNEEYLDFAGWLLNERGHGHLKSKSFYSENFTADYCQDFEPVDKQRRAKGHAVRAMYYYAAMADYAAIKGDALFRDALNALFHHITEHQMYITGGIGQNRFNEGFAEDDSLPSMTAYCETCAAIGMAMWNHRMSLIDCDARYADIVELELYNGILAGISLDGDRFFYENPLASPGNVKRKPWFSCSCCPTNLTRFIPSVSGYMYSTNDRTIYIHQYMSSRASISYRGGEAHIIQQTDYPIDGRISLSIDTSTNICLRVPGWCREFRLELNNEVKYAPLIKGYISLDVNADDLVALNLSLPPRLIKGRSDVRENVGRVAFARGPLIYCAEACDQDTQIPDEFFHSDLKVHPAEEIEVLPYSDELGGIVRLKTDGISLIPYYAWANRKESAMTVFISTI